LPVTLRFLLSRRAWPLAVAPKFRGTAPSPQQKVVLFDHLVGERERLVWDDQAERVGGLEVDQARRLFLGSSAAVLLVPWLFAATTAPKGAFILN
jgi:hypothetical protein